MDTKGFGEKQRRHSQSHRNRLCLLPYIHIHRHILPEVRRRLTIVGFTMVTSYVDRPSRLDETWKFRVILYIDFVSKGVCFHIHQTCKGKVGVAQELAIQLFILLTTRSTWQQNCKIENMAKKYNEIQNGTREDWYKKNSGQSQKFQQRWLINFLISNYSVP